MPKGVMGKLKKAFSNFMAPLEAAYLRIDENVASREDEKMSLVKPKFIPNENNAWQRGVEVTRQNYIDVATWCDGADICNYDENGVISKQRVQVKTKKGPRIAQIHDIVVKEVADDGSMAVSWFIIKSSEFLGFGPER